MKSLREQIAELEDLAPKGNPIVLTSPKTLPTAQITDQTSLPLRADLDPESHDTFPNEDENSDDAHSRDAGHEEFDGREHYEDVAPSSLRRPLKPVLGKRYAGSLVKRNDLLDREADREQNLNGDEHDVSAGEDPLAPVDDGSDEDAFAEGEGSGSESGHTASGVSYSVQGKRMKMVSGSVPEDEDEEIDSDEAFGEEDTGKFGAFKFLGSKQGKKQLDASMEEIGTADVSSLSDGSEEDQLMNSASMPVTGDESEASPQSSEDNSNDSYEGMDMDNEFSDDSSNLSDITPPIKTATKQSGALGDRAALKALLSSDTVAVASSLSAAASADAQKGRAVKAQYQTFDRILDARIKLQKGLAASNSISSEHDLSTHQDTIRAAEEASLKLWNTITSIRNSFAEAQSQNPQSESDKKRKRTVPVPATSSTSISTLWSTTQSLSSTTLPHHRTVLNKWSAKVRATNPIALESRSRLLNDSASQNSITDVIDSYLATEAGRHIAQSISTLTDPASHTNPTQNPTNTNEKPSHPKLILDSLQYNDPPFYQSLLRDLITTRSSTNHSSILLDLPSSSSTKLHPSSHPKRIDTKASKGRKVRYTVHEKVQNFMAAEGEYARGSSNWSEEARGSFLPGCLVGWGVEVVGRG